jgi:glycosyltransferase involved in cell wall biosynthesis
MVTPAIIRKYRKIVAVSNSVKNAVSYQTESSSLVIENGLDAENIKFKTEYTFTNESTLKLIQVSRLEHRIKGQDLLIQAGFLLSKMSIKFSIDFVGTGNSLEYLKDQVRKNNLENNVKFLGIKTRDWVHTMISKYDILVQPSRSEGFGLTALEGVFAKVPVITSDVEGLADLMKKINCPNQFERGNPHALLQLILAVRNQYLHGSIVEKCVRYFHSANDFYSIEKTTRLYNNLYESLADT